MKVFKSYALYNSAKLEHHPSIKIRSGHLL